MPQTSSIITLLTGFAVPGAGGTAAALGTGSVACTIIVVLACAASASAPQVRLAFRDYLAFRIVTKTPGKPGKKRAAAREFHKLTADPP